MTEQITFELTEKDLEFYTRNNKWEAEAGQFRVYVGGNSRDVQEVTFELKD